MSKRINKSEMWEIILDASFQAGRTTCAATFNEAMQIMHKALVALGKRKPEDKVPVALASDWCQSCGTKVR
jgi:hypothetical protein